MSKKKLDEDEFLELLPTPLNKALEWVFSGKITDVKTIIGIMWMKELKFNDKTGKMDDVTLGEVDDKLKSLKESVTDESLEIIQKLTQYLEDHPGIRFGQALFNLDINEFNKDGSLIYRDIYNDSDEEILKRVSKNF